MSRQRIAIPERIKQAVLTEAGYKCANPTCQTTLALDHHHIEYVSEDGSNEVSNLLALCPTCHSLHHRGTIPRQAVTEWKNRVVALNLKPGHELKEELERKQLLMGFDPSMFPRLIRELSQIELDVLEWAEESPQTVWVQLQAIAFGHTPSGRFRGSLGGEEFNALCVKLQALHLIEERPVVFQGPAIYAQKTIHVTQLGRALLQACRTV